MVSDFFPQGKICIIQVVGYRSTDKSPLFLFKNKTLNK